ncbi:MAG: LysE family translocator [Pseudomonadota bacterium]
MDIPIDPSRFIAFLGVMTAMGFAPGPANIFCIATGMEKGKRAALLGIAGLNCGTAIWFVGAALGLNALVIEFPEFFHYLTYIGAAYLFYLALSSFRQAFAKNIEPLHKIKISQQSPFYQGFLVQIANPKAILFFTAVLPPFMDMTKPAGPQLIVFSIATFAIDITAMCFYGLGGSMLKRRAEDARFRRGFALAVGILLMTAAALIVIEQ